MFNTMYDLHWFGERSLLRRDDTEPIIAEAKVISTYATVLAIPKPTFLRIFAKMSSTLLGKGVHRRSTKLEDQSEKVIMQDFDIYKVFFTKDFYL